MAQIRYNQDRAEYAIYLIYTVMIVAGIMLVSDFFQLRLLQDIAHGDFVSDDAINSSDMRVQFIAIVYLGVYVTSAIMFIRWFRRAYYNLHQVENRLSHTEGWASGGWFVPLANLWIPYRIMMELYDRTDRHLINKGVYGYLKLDSQVVGWWWGFWVILTIIDRISARMMRADDLDTLIYGCVFGIFTSALLIPAGFLVVKIIKDYQAIAFMLESDYEDQEIMEHLVVE